MALRGSSPEAALTLHVYHRWLDEWTSEDAVAASAQTQKGAIVEPKVSGYDVSYRA